MNYYNFTLSELEIMAEQCNNQLALVIAEKVKADYEDKIEELDEIKEQLREYVISPIIDRVKTFEEWMTNYHKSEDHLSNYFDALGDMIAYEGQERLNKELQEKLGDLTDSEIDYLITEIVHGGIHTTIRTSRMNTYPRNNEIVIASFVLGELQEWLPESIIKEIKENEITEDEINRNIDNYYDGKDSIFFDHSYEVVGCYADIDDLKKTLIEYRENN